VISPKAFSQKVAKETKRLVLAHTKFSSFAKATDDTAKQAPLWPLMERFFSRDRL
jgi:hypothetical protein